MPQILHFEMLRETLMQLRATSAVSENVRTGSDQLLDVINSLFSLCAAISMLNQDSTGAAQGVENCLQKALIHIGINEKHAIDTAAQLHAAIKSSRA